MIAAPTTAPISKENEIMPQGIAAPNENGGLVRLPVQQISTSTFNQRKSFPEAELQHLADSIKQHGVIEPIVVRPAKTPWHIQTGKRGDWYGVLLINPDQLNFENGHVVPFSYSGFEGAGYPHFISDEAAESPTVIDVYDKWPRYEIVAGERRFRASLMAGLKTVPCVVRQLTDDEAVEIAFVENLQRADLTPFEEAAGFQKMLDMPGMTQGALAARLKCSQTRIARTAGLLRLPQAVRDLIEEGKLSGSHGQRLIPYADFPQVCTSLALIAVQHEWPASKLDGKLDNNALHYLDQIKPEPVATLGYSTKFDWPEVCAKNCPFKAFRPTQYESRGVCLNPAHYKELQTAETAKEKAAQHEANQNAVAAFAARKRATELPVVQSSPTPPVAATPVGETGTKPEIPAIPIWPSPERYIVHRDDHVARAAQTIVNVAKLLMDWTPSEIKPAPATTPAPTPEMEIAPEPSAWPTQKLPVLSELDHSSHRRFDTAPPPGCDGNCPCRALGLNFGGKVSEYCTNPARFDKLKNDAKKLDKQDKRVKAYARLDAALDIIDAGLPYFDRPGVMESMPEPKSPTKPLDPAEWPLLREAATMRQTAAVAVFDAIQGSGHKYVEDAAARLGMKLTADYFKVGSYSKRPLALVELAQYSALKQIAFCAEVQIRKETTDAIECDYSSGTPRLIDHLIQHDDAQQAKAIVNL